MGHGEMDKRELRSGGSQTGPIHRGAARKVMFYLKGNRNFCVIHPSFKIWSSCAQELLIPTVPVAAVHGVAETWLRGLSNSNYGCHYKVKCVIRFLF